MLVPEMVNFRNFQFFNYSVAIVQVTQRSALSHQEVASMATRLKSKSQAI